MGHDRDVDSQGRTQSTWNKWPQETRQIAPAWSSSSPGCMRRDSRQIGLLLRLRNAIVTSFARRTDFDVTGYEPIRQEGELGPLDAGDVGTELGQVDIWLNHGLLQDLTHGDGSSMVWQHAAHEVNLMIATVIDGHGNHHLVISLQKLFGGGAREIPTAHHHPLHKSPLIAADSACPATNVIDNGDTHRHRDRCATRVLLDDFLAIALPPVLAHWTR